MLPGFAHASVTITDGFDRPERVQRVLDILSDARIPIFLIKLHRDAITFGLAGQDLPAVEQRLAEATEVFSARTNLARVNVMATNMSDLTGVMARIADALQAAGVHLFGVGDSHNTVQLLIDGSRAEMAVTELKAAFGLRAADG
jgi:aspartate kinase